MCAQVGTERQAHGTWKEDTHPKPAGGAPLRSPSVAARLEAFFLSGRGSRMGPRHDPQRASRTQVAGPTATLRSRSGRTWEFGFLRSVQGTLMLWVRGPPSENLESGLWGLECFTPSAAGPPGKFMGNG